MEGHTPEATASLAAMCEQAREYRESFSWCERIIQEHFGEEFAGIVAVFLFKIEPKSTDVQHWFWVIVGDLPPTHLVTDDLRNPYDALVAYLALRTRWIRNARRNENPPSEVMPVTTVPATEYWGRRLLGRIKTINDHFLLHLRKE
jgi:hypothetical protein